MVLSLKLPFSHCSGCSGFSHRSILNHRATELVLKILVQPYVLDGDTKAQKREVI